MSETISCTCSKPDCARCTWHAAADVFSATGDHDRCSVIVAKAINAGIDRSREEWGDGYCPRQHADEEWLDAQMEHAYRAGFLRGLSEVEQAGFSPDWLPAISALLATIRRDGPSPTDERLDLERVGRGESVTPPAVLANPPEAMK